MLKTLLATCVLGVCALALPAQAQSQQERDDKACGEKGAGPDTEGYSVCIANLKIDRFNLAQRRLREMEAMGRRGYAVSGTDDQAGGGQAMRTGPLPENMMDLMPRNTRALNGQAEAEVHMSVTTTSVCTTEDDAVKPRDDAADDAAKTDAADDKEKARAPKANCQTTAEVTKKVVQPTRRDYRDDPTSAMAHTYMHPGDIFHDHTQLGGP